MLCPKKQLLLKIPFHIFLETLLCINKSVYLYTWEDTLHIILHLPLFPHKIISRRKYHISTKKSFSVSFFSISIFSFQRCFLIYVTNHLKRMVSRCLQFICTILQTILFLKFPNTEIPPKYVFAHKRTYMCKMIF